MTWVMFFYNVKTYDKCVYDSDVFFFNTNYYLIFVKQITKRKLSWKLQKL